MGYAKARGNVAQQDTEVLIADWQYAQRQEVYTDPEALRALEDELRERYDKGCILVQWAFINAVPALVERWTAEAVEAAAPRYSQNVA